MRRALPRLSGRRALTCAFLYPKPYKLEWNHELQPQRKGRTEKYQKSGFIRVFALPVRVHLNSLCNSHD